MIHSDLARASSFTLDLTWLADPASARSHMARAGKLTLIWLKPARSLSYVPSQQAHSDLSRANPSHGSNRRLHLAPCFMSRSDMARPSSLTLDLTWLEPASASSHLTRANPSQGSIRRLHMAPYFMFTLDLTGLEPARSLSSVDRELLEPSRAKSRTEGCI